MADLPSSNDKPRIAPFVLGLAMVFAPACSKNPPPAPPPQPYPASPPPQPYAAPAPPPPGLPGLPGMPPALVSAALDMIAAAQKAIPCPPPGLPPEVTRFIDCAAIRMASNAVEYIPRVITAALPAQVDHRAQGLTGPVKDQNPVGACAGFAISSVMDNAIRRRGRTEVVSPLHIFSNYTHQNDLGALKGRPLTVEPVWPYDKVKACRISSPQHGGYCQSEAGVIPGSGMSDPYLMGEKARADSMGAFRIDLMEKLGPQHIDQIALLLAEGEAVWISLAFNRQAWDDDSVRSGYLPYYPAQDGVGHAVVLQGYRLGPTGREFLFQNSWGTDWGLAGYLWIPDSMLRTHMRHAYRLRISDAAGAPYVPPSGPAPQTVPTAGCPAGQVAVFGICFPQAPGASPAPGGFPTIGNCPAGTVPNLLAPGQCVKMP
jgi:hypothetical protein